MNFLKAINAARAKDDDNEMIACLLMITKSSNLPELNEKERTKLLNAIGFTFLHRLLCSHEENHPNDIGIFSLGMSIVSAFLDIDRMACHPFLHRHTLTFNKVITCSSCQIDHSVLVDDALSCLKTIALKSPNTLLYNGTMAALLRANLMFNASDRSSADLFAFLCNNINDDRDCDHHVALELNEVVLKLLATESFKNYDCAMANTLLAGIINCFQNNSHNWTSTIWLKSVYLKLGIIVKSRIGTNILQQTLLVLCYLGNIGFTISCMCETDVDILMLHVHRVCIEIRMNIDDRSKNDMLIQYFVFLERFIAFLLKDGEQCLNATQLYASLQAIIDCIRCLCDFLSRELQKQRIIKGNSIFHEAVLRMCCCFVSEDSSIVSEKFQQLVVPMLDLCKTNVLSKYAGIFMRTAIEAIHDNFTEDEQTEIEGYLAEI
ncbi:hypothetical protein GJ496_003386 [Pomphorhynchus laevis]|nr:hypothetical protein GJ496_003386 [Pomphorhynchus laevis]